MSNSELYKFIKDEEKLFYLLFPDLGFEKCVSKAFGFWELNAHEFNYKMHKEL